FRDYRESLVELDLQGFRTSNPALPPGLLSPQLVGYSASPGLSISTRL
ncbi:hypothetical protein LEMLEM_LOCUS2281, partial [Lemmus lemmus]